MRPLRRSLRPRPFGLIAALGAVGLIVATPAPAFAQAKWDAGVQLGATKRFLTDRSGYGPDAGFGPVVQGAAHVAVLPLLRAGVYADFDASPAGGLPMRRLFSGGIRAKLLAPKPRGPARLWLFAGFGYAGAYSPSFSRAASVHLPGHAALQDGDVHGAGAWGSFFEVPVGVGASYRVRRPWELTAELGARFGFGFTGSTYSGRPPAPSGVTGPILAPLGKDTVGVSLLVGVAYGR